MINVQANADSIAIPAFNAHIGPLILEPYSMNAIPLTMSTKPKSIVAVIMLYFFHPQIDNILPKNPSPN
jgi:hypothetical protein